jgi:hypothetical protein
LRSQTTSRQSASSCRLRPLWRGDRRCLPFIMNNVTEKRLIKFYTHRAGGLVALQGADGGGDDGGGAVKLGALRVRDHLHLGVV